MFLQLDSVEEYDKETSICSDAGYNFPPEYVALNSLDKISEITFGSLKVSTRYPLLYLDFPVTESTIS